MPNIFAKLASVSPICWAIIAVIVVASIIALIIVSKKDAQARSTNTTKMIVYGGMCIALSFILSYIRLYKMPQGGSITLASMFPLVLYSLVFGPVAGIIAGVAYGFLQFIQDAYMVHWAQLLLDYPLAYGCLGLAGLAPFFFKKNIKWGTLLGVVIAVLGRGIMHLLSGVIFFGASAPAGQSAIVYSLIYNASYILPELIITLILAYAVVNTPIYTTLKRTALAA